MNALTVFTSEIRLLDGLYSLNDLHKASGGAAKHKPANFLRLDTTLALIEEIQCSDLSTATKSINGGHKRGTYVCKELVYAYAMWISPKFHLAVIRAFDAASMPVAKAEDTPPPSMGFDGFNLGAEFLAGQRFLLSFSEDRARQYRVQPIPADAYVMSLPEVLKALAEGDAPLTTDELFSFIEAAQARLKSRLVKQEGHSRPFAQSLMSPTG